MSGRRVMDLAGPDLDPPKPIVKPVLSVAPPPMKRMNLVPLSDVEMRSIRWVIPGWLPEGYLTLVSGDGRAGKSSLLYSVAGDLSRGDCCLGLSYPDPIRAKTLLIGAEDDYGAKVKPFLLARDADMGRVVYHEATLDEKGEHASFSLWDIDALRIAISENEVKVVIVDPASALLPAGVDDNSDVEVRSVLTPLAALAMELGIAIILVKHVGKSAGRKATGAHLGSAAWRNICRSAWLVLRDCHTENERVLFDVGSSVADDQIPIRYKIAGIEDDRRNALRYDPDIAAMEQDERERILSQMYSVEFMGEDGSDPDELMQRQARATSGDNRSSLACADWLRVRVGKESGWLDSMIEMQASEKGFSKRQYQSAKSQLRPEGLITKPRSKGGAWFIAFGDVAKMPIGEEI